MGSEIKLLQRCAALSRNKFHKALKAYREERTAENFRTYQAAHIELNNIYRAILVAAKG